MDIPPLRGDPLCVFLCVVVEPKVRIELTAYALPRRAPRRRPILNSLEDSSARFGQRLRVERNRWSTVDTSRETVRGAEAGRQPRCDREQDAPRPASGHRVARLETLVASRWARMGTTRRDFGAAMCASAPVRTGWRPTPNPSSNRTLVCAMVMVFGLGPEATVAIGDSGTGKATCSSASRPQQRRKGSASNTPSPPGW